MYVTFTYVIHQCRLYTFLEGLHTIIARNFHGFKILWIVQNKGVSHIIFWFLCNFFYKSENPQNLSPTKISKLYDTWFDVAVKYLLHPSIKLRGCQIAESIIKTATVCLVITRAKPSIDKRAQSASVCLSTFVIHNRDKCGRKQYHNCTMSSARLYLLNAVHSYSNSHASGFMQFWFFSSSSNIKKKIMHRLVINLIKHDRKHMVKLQMAFKKVVRLL